MKKMRKLLPAFAMLLVSAIMMSTASFAWFTMNEQVTATGMSVQAQAGGSMIIDDEALKATSKGMDVDFALSGSSKISPTTYFKTAPVTGGDAGWYIPDSATAVIDPLTGENTTDDAWTTTNAFVADKHYKEYIVYIGVSGDSVKKNVHVVLNNEATLRIEGAYAVAFYVTETDVAAAVDAEPALILHMEAGKNVNGGTSVKEGNLYDAAIDIPSTVGVTTGGVGIRVTMRVFVDGNLEMSEKYTPMVPKYNSAKNTPYDPDETYYVKSTAADGTETYSFAAVENVYADGANIDADWYTYQGMVEDTAHPQTLYYVNNANAPEAPTGLDVTFSLVD